VRIDIVIDDIFDGLDEKCWQCFEGKVLATGQTCDICAGTGRLLTEAGEKLLDFIRRNRKRLYEQGTTQP
jgi:hypothetical protein